LRLKKSSTPFKNNRTTIGGMAKLNKKMTTGTKNVLVLQGGGALGAYQAGVFEALAQRNTQLDWVVGTSIGAINAAIIAGNLPKNRVAKLKGFWDTVTADGGTPLINLFGLHFGVHFAEWFKPWVNSTRSLGTIINGVPGFFSARDNGLWNIDKKVPTAEASFYDTSALEATLNQFVDFDYLNQANVRLTVCAVNVATAELKCFDNTDTTPITARHIMASGALPPGFAPVEIDGEFYWDGGVYSNTPLDVVLDEQANGHNKQDTLCFMIDLWDPTETLPTSIGGAMTRLKNTQYASRSTERLADHRRQLDLRNVIKQLGEKLPLATRNKADVRAMLAQGEVGGVNVVRLVMKALPDDDQFKDIDFSKATIATRWKAGAEDAERMFGHQSWLKPLAAGVGMAIHELEQL
jgi:NTE family protein